EGAGSGSGLGRDPVVANDPFAAAPFPRAAPSVGHVECVLVNDDAVFHLCHFNRDHEGLTVADGDQATLTVLADPSPPTATVRFEQDKQLVGLRMHARYEIRTDRHKVPRS